MAELTLPRYIITQRCMSAGHRTAKKPVLIVPYIMKSILSYGSSNVYEPLECKGVFEKWEYRFWAMACTGELTRASLIAECRGCGSIGSGDSSSRQLHFAHGGCAKRLCAAYKLLLRDRMCVICNVKTSHTKWGVPICGSTCEQAWCEVETCPSALRLALQLVGEI